jgi:hypothetical protein
MVAPSTNDVFEKVQYTGVERPEYVLKNGKAFNVYAALAYIKTQQEQIKNLEERVALIIELKREINPEHSEDSDPMFVSGWRSCAKRVDDFF